MKSNLLFQIGSFILSLFLKLPSFNLFKISLFFFIIVFKQQKLFRV